MSFAAGKDKEPEQYDLAKRIFDQVKKGDFYAVISSLTFMEFLAVCRTQKGREKENFDGLTSDKQLEYVLRESKEMYDTTVAEVIQLTNLKLEEGHNVNIKKLMDTAYQMMLEAKGKVRFHSNCKKCGSDRRHSSYKALGTDDFIHALFAREIGCELFYTFDGDFEEIKNHHKVEPMEIRVIKW